MAGDTAAIIQVIDICIVSDRSVRGPGVLNIPPTSYLAPHCLHWMKCPHLIHLAVCQLAPGMMFSSHRIDIRDVSEIIFDSRHNNDGHTGDWS